MERLFSPWEECGNHRCRYADMERRFSPCHDAQGGIGCCTECEGMADAVRSGVRRDGCCVMAAAKMRRRKGGAKRG